MSILEHGPLDMRELTEEQRPVAQRLIDNDWTPVILGYITGQLALRHARTGQQCFIHRDGRVEYLAVDAA